jgi:hypothetical protein
MDKKKLQIWSMLALAAIFLMAAVAALAQIVPGGNGPITEPGGEGEGAAFMAELSPSYVSGVTPGLPPDENPQAAAPGTPAQLYYYYMVPGATLRGRSSTATLAYDGLGCIHATSISSDEQQRLFNTELHLPDGSEIKYLRLYFYDDLDNREVRGHITLHEPGTKTEDVISVSSGVANKPGYGHVVNLTAVSHFVDNSIKGYTLIGWPSASSASLKVCGLRVAYYPPPFYPVFLPTVRR